MIARHGIVQAANLASILRVSRGSTVIHLRGNNTRYHAKPGAVWDRKGRAVWDRKGPHISDRGAR
eukprot:5076070-Prymnesium_polylepis.2